MPKLYHPLFKSERFRRATQDRFFIVIEADDPQFEEGRNARLPRVAGRPCRSRRSTAITMMTPRTPTGTRRTDAMPRKIIYVLLAAAGLSLIPVGLMYKSRHSGRETTRVQVVYDMDNQVYAKPQTKNAFFADGQSMRGHPEGTVARSQLQESNELYRGVVSDTTYVEDFPLEVTPRADAARPGAFRHLLRSVPRDQRQRQGHGPTCGPRRWPRAPGPRRPDLTSQTVVERPVGHIYHTITNGIRTMPAYGPQIAPKDRWAIVAYVRALQLSRGARASTTCRPSSGTRCWPSRSRSRSRPRPRPDTTAAAGEDHSDSDPEPGRVTVSSHHVPRLEDTKTTLDGLGQRVFPDQRRDRPDRPGRDLRSGLD